MLSNAPPKDQLTAIQVVTDFVEAFKAVAANPNIEQLARDAFALPEREQAKAEEARKAIADNQAVLADIKKQQDVISGLQAELDAKKTVNETQLRKIEEGNSRLDTRESELDDQADTQAKRAKELDQKQRELDAGISKLTQGNADLDARQREIDAYELDLKNRAAKLQELTKGL
jgi:chromosome segregation ATPase